MTEIKGDRGSLEVISDEGKVFFILRSESDTNVVKLTPGRAALLLDQLVQHIGKIRPGGEDAE